MKKIWQKPKLIILARGRPEESVLAGCKMAGSGAAPRTKKTGCQKHCNAQTVSVVIHVLGILLDPKSHASTWCQSDSSK